MGVMTVRYVYDKLITLAGTAGAATTWNSADKTAGLNLSNSDRTVTYPSGGNTVQAIRSTAGTTSNQKVYIEHVITTISSGWRIGWAKITAPLTFDFGNTTPSTSFLFVSNSQATSRCADSADDFIAALTTSITSGDRYGLAFDTATGKVWIRENGGAWNNNVGGTQDPATGQGGLTIPFSGPYYAFVGMDANNGDTFTTNFSSTHWADTVPSGFTQLAA